MWGRLVPMSSPKPFKTYDEQVQILVKRGLRIDDRDATAEILHRVSYYHLRGYYIDLLDNSGMFLPGASCEKIFARFQSDRALRSILFKAPESVELLIRNECSYVLGEKYGPLGYRNPQNFRNEEINKVLLTKITKEANRSRELFVRHHVDKYDGDFPIWVAVELLSFGTVSAQLYKNMLNDDQREVSEALGIKSAKVTQSFLHSLSVLRNSCAHHSRIYARSFSVPCKILNHDEARTREFEPGFKISPRRLFALLLALRALLTPQRCTEMVEGIAGVLRENPDYRRGPQGLPDSWQEILRGDLP